MSWKAEVIADRNQTRNAGGAKRGITMSDLHFENHGTIFTCTPQTEVGERWLGANVNAEPYMWMGPSLCIEGFRNAYDIAMGARADGLEVD